MRDLETYVRPKSAAEAVRIKREYGPAAMYLAGGSDVLVHRPRELKAVIDIRQAGLGTIGEDDGWIVIGGGALLRDVEASLPSVASGMLRAAVRETAPWLIRNAATLTGNLANASPAADAVPALLALDAELTVLGEREERISAESILLGPHRTSLGDRLITELRIPSNAAERRAAFIKHSRSKSDIAQVNIAVSLTLNSGVARDVRIVLGAVAPTAMRARQAEEILEGQRPDAELMARVQQQVREEVRPISDWRASEDYRRRVSGVLARRALERALAPRNGGDRE